MRALLPAPVFTLKVTELQKSVLDTWKFLRPLFNTLTAIDKDSLISKKKWMQTIQMHFPKQPNFFF